MNVNDQLHDNTPYYSMRHLEGSKFLRHLFLVRLCGLQYINYVNLCIDLV